MTTKYFNGHPFIEYNRETYAEDECLKRSREFYDWMNKRRTVRDFSDKPIPKERVTHYYSING